MAIASSILAVCAFLSISLVALLLIRFYLPLRTTPQYLLFPVYLALVIPCSIIVLVPIDLASNSGADKDRGVVLGYRVLLVAWRIAYWLSFALTWAILPILQSYSDSGHRSPSKRFLSALQDNARYQLIVLTLATIGLIYIVSTNGFNYPNIKALVIALSYFYALSFAVYLMGHGLVSLPRNLWRSSSISGKLRRIQTKAPKIHDALILANERLEEVEKEVWALSKKGRGSAAEFQEWIEELVDMLQLPESSLSGINATLPERSRSPIPQVITEQYLASLTKRLRAASHRRARFSAAWDSLVRSAANTQTILDSKASKKLTFRPNPHSIAPIFDRWSILTPYTRYILYYHILPPLRIILSVFLALGSICIIWSEIVNVNNTASDKLSIIGQTVVHHRKGDRPTIGFAGQVIASAWIAYMCAAAYDSMTSVKVWGGYALVRHRTSGSSACFYASYACRLTVPLAYNFTNFLPKATVKPTVFQNFFGVSIQLTWLGDGFNRYFPVLILLPVFATLFNLYGKVKDCLGFGADVIEDSDEEAAQYSLSSGWREGRDLIDRELGGSTSSSSAAAHNQRHSAGTGNTVSSNLLNTEAPTPLSTQRSQSSTQAQTRLQQQRTRQARLDTGIVSANIDDEDEGAFGSFLHRVKNTLDINTTGDGRPPKWLNDIGDKFKKPKWMNNEQNTGTAGASSSSGGGANNTFGVARPKWMKGNFFTDDDSN